MADEVVVSPEQFSRIRERLLRDGDDYRATLNALWDICGIDASGWSGEVKLTVDWTK